MTVIKTRKIHCVQTCFPDKRIGGVRKFKPGLKLKTVVFFRFLPTFPLEQNERAFVISRLGHD